MLAEYPDVRFDGPPGAYGKTPYPKRYIAIHNTSNTASDTAEADYAEHRADHVSTHYYVDSDSITQSLRTEYGANHAGSTTGNRHAIAYEITGTNGRSRTWWLANVAWSVLARQIARDCRKHDIVPKLLTLQQMGDGKTTGIVTHNLMRQAWGGTTHTDPGPGFPMDHLLALVAAEMEDDMEQDETLKNPTGNARRNVGQVLADVSNLRDWLYGLPTAAGVNPPPAGSRAQLLVEASLRSLVTATPVDVAALAAGVAEALRPDLEAAAEAAVRRVLGAVDGATPPAGS